MNDAGREAQLTAWGLRQRAVEAADFTAVADIYNRQYAAYGLDNRTTPDECAASIATPYPELVRAFVLIDGADAVVAYAGVELHSAVPRAQMWCLVAPDYQGKGIGGWLLERTDTDAVHMTRARYRNAPLTLERTATQHNSAALDLLARAGYTHVHTSYVMRTYFTETISEPPMPSGVALRPFDWDAHGQMLFEVDNAAFAGHFGFDPGTYAEFELQFRQFPYDRPDLYQVAWADDRIVGYAIVEGGSETMPFMGWIGSLGVSADHRRRGLATALLLRAFAAMQRDGMTAAGLGVDSQNEHNALALYQRAGMHIHNAHHTFRKTIAAFTNEEIPLG